MQVGDLSRSRGAVASGHVSGGRSPNPGSWSWRDVS